MARGCWWYYFSKFTEFFDTIFFVMRKRYDQVSTLHVIHHGIMPASVWWGVKFTPGGHSSFFGFLNTFVHIIMYTYYMLAAMGPKVQKYLWWKKYLTVLQMVQFVLVMVHAFQLLFRNDCNYPIYFAYFIGAHAVLFYFLFSNFYKQAYKEKVNVNVVIVTAKNGIKIKKFIFVIRNSQKQTNAVKVKKDDDDASSSADKVNKIDSQPSTDIYQALKNKMDSTTTRSRHYVGSAN